MVWEIDPKTLLIGLKTKSIEKKIQTLLELVTNQINKFHLYKRTGQSQAIKLVASSSLKLSANVHRCINLRKIQEFT